MNARKKKSTAFQIRPGTARDIPAILKMIRELAEYEHLSHQVKATEAILRQDGFGRSRYFQTLICESADTRKRHPIGFALYFFSYSTFLAQPTLYLEDLYVLSTERGKGAGGALLSALARIALKRKCGRMDWAVLDFNAPAIRFYEKIGAKMHKEWILTRLTGTPLRRLAERR
jgi:GNAT superfamily N-acetyltransferase